VTGPALSADGKATVTVAAADLGNRGWNGGATFVDAVRKIAANGSPGRFEGGGMHSGDAFDDMAQPDQGSLSTLTDQARRGITRNRSARAIRRRTEPTRRTGLDSAGGNAFRIGIT
jgi:hypothetical protein